MVLSTRETHFRKRRCGKGKKERSDVLDLKKIVAYLGGESC